MHKNNKRIAAAVLSLALGFSAAGAGIFAPVAGAQVTVTAGEVSTIDLNADVTLNIEKLKGNPDGSTPGATDPVAGIKFEIRKVNLTNGLDTLAGWQEVAGLTAAGVAAQDLPVLTTLTTDSDGKASISTGDNTDFTVGLYLVTEKQSAGYSVIDPFLITLPLNDSTGWNYAPTVKPKNQMDEGDISKTVNDLGAVVGKEIEYTISAGVPVGNLTQVVVEDDLQTGLTPATNVVVTYGTTTFEAGTDYTVNSTDGDGNKLTVTFTAAGLATLQPLVTEGTKLEVSFKTTIESLPDAENGGVIENEASIDFGGGIKYSTDPDEGGDDTGTETRLGKLSINKVAKDGTAITGDATKAATFELWRCNLNNDNKYETVGTSLGSYTTDPATGVATQVVQVSDWVNNATPGTGTGAELCVVETSAPAGYVVNPAPQKVDFDTTTTDDPYDMIVTVTNVEDTITGNLPNTGGLGTMGLIAAGVVVAAAGGAAALRGNRSRA
ncbi:type 1 fimbrial major subunit [Corynebacterium humireducens NBRC 106098 = DSM 45392]|uniref:Type 1 fimbrial major subunit n=1 Tax=Corynebacterium humireducens NBRC 106098 = DSM 45392 TaxID=1223515 RepID=A0A0B5D616_9CORY|nr:SpaH/EbpB family LPXTG-anchored major pilin [Corynebacterium humireducens]AJE34276.1 type 1 fimbrial major subunit [Corynebacterium humireducens NBRC 106098 = DSM 45392]